jgi:general secretion pathway protein D
LVRENKARLDHVSSNVTLSGHRTVTEEIVEARYPTEFAPPSFPGPKEVNSDHSTPEPEPKAGQAVAKTSPVTQRVSIKNPLPPGAYPKKAMVPAVGLTYETRNTGFTIEIEPVLGPDGVWVDGQTVPQFVRNLGPIEMSGAGKAYPPQPLFETRKYSGMFSAVIGQQQFLSTYNHPGGTGVNGSADDGRVSLGFIRVVPVR